MTRRARGTGSLRQKGNIWWIRFPDGRGKRVEESSRSSKRSVAVKLLNKRLGEVQEGRYQGPAAEKFAFADLEPMTVAHFTPMRSKTRAIGHVDEKTGKLKGGALSHLRAHFGLYLLKNITYDAMMSYVAARREEGASDSTIGYELAVLRKGLRLAKRSGKLDRMPDIPTDELSIDNVRQGFFEPNEFEAIKAQLPEHHRGWAEFAYLTGWRVRSEVLTREWRHVDFEAGTVRLEVGETKNKKGRTFPIDVYPELEAVLKSQRDYTEHWERVTGQINSWVFHRKGKPIVDFYVAWRSACERAGYPGRIVHDFRRTAVRRLERAGVSRSVAKQLVGHETDAIYNRYSIVTESDLREGLKKVAQFHEQASAKVLPMNKA